MSTLINLPDEVILNIFAYVCPFDLLNLSKTCSRFWRLVKCRPLSDTIDLSLIPLSLDRFRKAMRILQKTTKHLKIYGMLDLSRSSRWSRKCHTFSSSSLAKLGLTCPKLVSIELEQVYFQENVEFIHFPTTLESITLTSCKFASSCAFFISQSIPVKLRYFHLRSCFTIPKKVLLAIGKWPNLESLSLQHCKNATDDIIAEMENMENLISLNISLTPASKSDTILEIIGLKMRKLENLKIVGYNSTGLNPNDCVSDAGILNLDHRIANNLISLDISNTSITDESLVFIQNVCRSLRELHVTNTDVTTQGIDTLKIYLPNCKVFV